MHAVKILFHDDGMKSTKPKWHLGLQEAATTRTFCEGEAYGEGDSRCEYETKSLKDQKVTCLKCIELINKIKTVKT